jgi:hypothetical protein
MEKELKELILSMEEDLTHGETLEAIAKQVPAMRPNLVNHTNEVIKKYCKLIEPFMRSKDEETQVVSAVTILSLLELKIAIITHYGKQD